MLFLLGQTEAGGDPQSWWDILRHDVIPVASAYLVFLGMVLAYRRVGLRRVRPPRPSDRPAVTWPDLVRYLAITAAGGYVVFVAIVVAFYLLLGGESPEFIRQAFVEGSLLAFAMVIPAFLTLSWFQELLSHRHNGRMSDLARRWFPVFLLLVTAAFILTGCPNGGDGGGGGPTY